MADPDFKVQGTDLPKGTAQRLEQGLEFAEDATVAIPEEQPAADFTEGPDEFDDFVFEPTAFPERPITHGVPFGPGANAVAGPRRTERQLQDTMAEESLRNPNVPEQMKEWAVRRLAGE